jgi:hypothetical protein
LEALESGMTHASLILYNNLKRKGEALESGTTRPFAPLFLCKNVKIGKHQENTENRHHNRSKKIIRMQPHYVKAY